MLAAWRRHAAVYGCYARLTLQSQLEFPSYLVSWLFLVPFQWLSSAYMLRVLTRTFDGLAGWNFGQLMFIYGLALVSHGLTVTFFIQTWSIGEAALKGDFDRLLVRPLNVFVEFVGSYLNVIGLFDLVPGIAILAYGCRATGFELSLANLAKLLLVIVGAVLIRVAIFTVAGASVFWTGRGRAPLVLMAHLMERTTLYPLDIYPYGLQTLLTFLVPLGFVSFYPACELLGRADAARLPFGLALWTPLVGGFSFAAAYGVFRAGLARWDTSGS